jgi:uncharacterized membrane protein YgcG
MQCPYCQTLQQAGAAECPACRITFPRTSALVGALPRLAPVVADTTRSLGAAEQGKLKQRIAAIQRRFPQLVLQVVVHQFPPEHPFSMHVFWLFNAGNFAGDICRGKDNHALLVALDPTRGESAIMPGYGLETFLKSEALDHLLELAGPAWETGRWADGLFRVLDGLDQLLESIAIPIHPTSQEKGEF